MRFATGLPGVNLYPPTAQPWEVTMGAEDFQRIARTADELGYDSISIPEHIVVPDEMVELMGPSWSHAMTVMAFVRPLTRERAPDPVRVRPDGERGGGGGRHGAPPTSLEPLNPGAAQATMLTATKAA